MSTEKLFNAINNFESSEVRVTAWRGIVHSMYAKAIGAARAVFGDDNDEDVKEHQNQVSTYLNVADSAYQNLNDENPRKSRYPLTVEDLLEFMATPNEVDDKIAEEVAEKAGLDKDQVKANFVASQQREAEQTREMKPKILEEIQRVIDLDVQSSALSEFDLDALIFKSEENLTKGKMQLAYRAMRNSDLAVLQDVKHYDAAIECLQQL